MVHRYSHSTLAWSYILLLLSLYEPLINVFVMVPLSSYRITRSCTIHDCRYPGGKCTSRNSRLWHVRKRCARTDIAQTILPRIARADIDLTLFVTAQASAWLLHKPYMSAFTLPVFLSPLLPNYRSRCWKVCYSNKPLPRCCPPDRIQCAACAHAILPNSRCCNIQLWLSVGNVTQQLPAGSI